MLNIAFRVARGSEYYGNIVLNRPFRFASERGGGGEVDDNVYFFLYFRKAFIDGHVGTLRVRVDSAHGV